MLAELLNGREQGGAVIRRKVIRACLARGFHGPVIVVPTPFLIATAFVQLGKLQVNGGSLGRHAARRQAQVRAAPLPLLMILDQCQAKLLSVYVIEIED